ncbi:copper resistance CopC family protein [Pseudolysinimonas sp.]|uniref:copper resistance CopC family protein n=1 Tax=Pseudolysinimonas sp. TaxID=2680009 RepID=UPI003F7DCF0F
MRRALAAGAAVAALVAAVVLGVAAPASAHNQVVSTTPAANATLTELPARFDVTTNLPLLDVSGDGAGFAFEVRSSAGKYYGDGCLSIVDATMSTTPALGPAGSYRVIWQLVSQDGHTVSGSYSFTWQPPAGFTPSKAYADPQNCGRAPRAASTAAPGDPDAERSQTVPVADVLWIGGALVAVALAAVIAIVLLSRRGRSGQSRAKRARNPE